MRRQGIFSWILTYRIYLLVAATFGLLTILVPGFGTADTVRNVFQRASIPGLMALGLTIAIIAGQLDLSVASILALAGVVMMLLHETTHPVIGVLGAILVGLCLGSFSGLLVARAGINSFIVTLGGMIGFRGLAHALSGSAPIGGTYPELSVLVDRSLLGPLTPRILIFVAIAVLLHLLLTRTKLGRNLMAVGGNAEGARLFGIATWRYVVLALALSGVLSAIGGILLALSLNTGAPIYGEQDLIIVIAAVLVGGTSLSGGRGSAMGTFAGVIFLSAITTGMNLSNVPVFWQSVTIGIVLIVVILVDGYYLRRQRTHSIRRLNPRVARAST